MSPRHLLLGGALAAAVYLSVFPPVNEEEEPQVVAPIRRAAPAVASPVAAPAAGISGRPAFTEAAAADLFPVQSFRPPPPPPPKIIPPPPPPPMAPPLPFTFVGIWTEEGRETVFLNQGERVLFAHKGEKVAGGWRLDDVQTGSLLFTYEPLNQQKTLRISP